MCYSVMSNLCRNYGNQESMTLWFGENGREFKPYLLPVNVPGSRICKIHHPYHTNIAWAATGPLPRGKWGRAKASNDVIPGTDVRMQRKTNFTLPEFPACFLHPYSSNVVWKCKLVWVCSNRICNEKETKNTAIFRVSANNVYNKIVAS
jgi:hypothetical protein